MRPSVLTRRGKREAEALMTDTAEVTRGGGGLVVDPETGDLTPGGETVGTFPCKVQTTVAQAASPEAGGHAFTVEQLQLHFPVDTLLQGGDQVTITESRDPQNVGLVFRLVELARGTYRTADRWNVELPTS